MKYIQGNIVFEFKNLNNSLDEFYATIIINNVEVEFCINKKYFEDENVDWEFVQNFTSSFITNFDFINKKTKKIAINLYNEYGNKMDDDDKFNKDNCQFANLLLIELVEPSEIFPYPKAPLYYFVDNVINSEFTYLNSSCIFDDHREAHFVGVKASSIED